MWKLLFISHLIWLLKWTYMNLKVKSFSSKEKWQFWITDYFCLFKNRNALKWPKSIWNIIILLKLLKYKNSRQNKITQRHFRKEIFLAGDWKKKTLFTCMFKRMVETPNYLKPRPWESVKMEWYAFSENCPKAFPSR